MRYNGKCRQLYKAYVRFQSNLYGILVVKMALGRVVLQEDMLRFSPVILPLLHTPLSFMHHRSYIILPTTSSLNKTSDLCCLIIYQRGVRREPCLRASARPILGQACASEQRKCLVAGLVQIIRIEHCMKHYTFSRAILFW